MINSTYDPCNVKDFEKTKLSFNGQKVHATCPAGQSINLDLVMTDDHLLTGAAVSLTNNIESDCIKFQVVHPTYGVVNQFIDWYAREFDKDLSYPAKLPAGLTLRVVYTSTGALPVEVYINHILHKVMI